MNPYSSSDGSTTFDKVPDVLGEPFAVAVGFNCHLKDEFIHSPKNNISQIPTRFPQRRLIIDIHCSQPQGETHQDLPCWLNVQKGSGMRTR